MLAKRFLALLERGVMETRFVLIVIVLLNMAKIVHLTVDWGGEWSVSWLSLSWILVLGWNPWMSWVLNPENPYGH